MGASHPYLLAGTVKGETMAASGHQENRRPGAQGGDRPTREPDAVEEPAERPGRDDAERPEWPYTARVLIAAALAVLALGGVAVVVTLSDPQRLGVAFSGGEPAGPRTGPAGRPAAEPGGLGAAAAQETATGEVATAHLAGRGRATFELVDGLTRLDLRVEDLGDELYRIGTPSDGGLRAEAEVRGDVVRLRFAPSGRPGPGTAEVVLNAAVTWRLRLAGGVTEQRLDLTAARLAELELAGGATTTELRLPEITGTVTVRMTGGVNRFDVVVPGTPPVRVRAAAGAGAVAVHGERTDGVAAGALLGSPGWDRLPDRLFLDLVAGANTVTVGATDRASTGGGSSSGSR
ncbi:hypothetical protein [Micromonospora sp. NPDC049799]|uniref:hypothetical protein n=1 Tax=Micromonospora sp. NPDC049799 TaxID=3154741 RepID=UPI0034026C1A